MAKRYFSATAARAKLVNTITSGATTMQVDTVSGFPNTTPFSLILERDTIREEVVDVTNVAGTTLTITRGVDSTPAVEHSSNAIVEHGVSARDHREANDHVNATANVHGIVGSLATYIDTAEADAKSYTDTQVAADRSRLTALEGRADVHDHSSNTTGGNIPQASVTGLVAGLAAKAPLASPTFTGTVTVPDGSVAGAAVNKGQLDTKANLSGATFTGAVTVPTATASGHAVTKAQLDLKADLASPTFTGTVTGVNATFTGNVVVPNADASGEAVNKSQLDAAVTALRVTNESAQVLKVRAGSWVGALNANGRATISFGTTFTSFIGVVLTWGDDAGIPLGTFSTAPAPYVYDHPIGSASDITIAGGSGGATCRVNWVAYGT